MSNSSDFEKLTKCGTALTSIDDFTQDVLIGLKGRLEVERVKGLSIHRPAEALPILRALSRKVEEERKRIAKLKHAHLKYKH